MKASVLLDTCGVVCIANGQPITAGADGDASTRDRPLIALGEEGHVQVVAC
jgi:hypothetical protein